VELVVITEISDMLRTILTGSLMCAAFTIASLPTQAQTQAPASPTPVPEQGAEQGTEQSTDVSNQEVQQFATALKQMRSIHEEAQAQAGQIIQEQGLTVQRFNEIIQSQQNPQSGASVSPEERQKFDQALAQITQIQQSTEQRMQEAIQSTGMNLQRFNQIFAIARQDQALKQRIEQVLQN
jgi:uncharacterized membrane protein